MQLVCTMHKHPLEYYYVSEILLQIYQEFVVYDLYTIVIRIIIYIITEFLRFCFMRDHVVTCD